MGYKDYLQRKIEDALVWNVDPDEPAQPMQPMSGRHGCGLGSLPAAQSKQEYINTFNRLRDEGGDWTDYVLRQFPHINDKLIALMNAVVQIHDAIKEYNESYALSYFRRFNAVFQQAMSVTKATEPKLQFISNYADAINIVSKMPFYTAEALSEEIRQARDVLISLNEDNIALWGYYESMLPVLQDGDKILVSLQKNAPVDESWLAGPTRFLSSVSFVMIAGVAIIAAKTLLPALKDKLEK